MLSRRSLVRKGRTAVVVKKEGSVIEMEGGMGDTETLSSQEDPSQRSSIFPPELMISCNDEMVVIPR